MPFNRPSDGGLKSLFKDHLPEIFWQPIEASSATGLPDMHYCFKHPEYIYCSGWIEFKLAKTNRLQHPPTPQQIAWAEQYWRQSGRVWCIVRKKNETRKNKCDELHFFHGEGMRYLSGTFGGIENVPKLYQKGKWSGGPSKWDWKAIKEILT